MIRCRANAVVRSNQESSRAPEDRDAAEGGYTLIELLLVALILPMIIGAISVAFVSIITLQSSVSNRTDNAADAQIVSSHLDSDVQSALQLTTNATATCGSGTQLLGLKWDPDPAGVYQTVVSYITKPPVAPATHYSLVRQYCSSGVLTPASSSVVSGDIASDQRPPAISPTGYDTSGGYVAAQPVTAVTLSITEPGSNYPYTLVALPATSSSTGSQMQPSIAPSKSCDAAAGAKGATASRLCPVRRGGGD